MKVVDLNNGQTLITLLFIMIVGITVTTATAVVVLVNSQTANKFEQGAVVLLAAESGIENAIINLIRDPNYTGETMIIQDTSVAIEISGVNPKIITSIAKTENFLRQIEAQADYSNYTWVITSWKETF